MWVENLAVESKCLHATESCVRSKIVGYTICLNCKPPFCVPNYLYSRPVLHFCWQFEYLFRKLRQVDCIEKCGVPRGEAI